ncbi:7TM diverse intracellular signaling domain-containing protein [Neolewinella lacunae]|uniref:histidine kinase n=1 Tax=Neolewinella lacunae TaxID=1517758 RepID=A0A923T6F0_9BACT|nr:7TM diverse intracellular signaling domain-containing protein [Neolewinella lacunae]MBC6993355.1 response regulator [Neolewinella lacunae]MDN3636345.1 7TM diverse intracellular signaling domain-containing protein [Neolewinella lacunae]
MKITDWRGVVAVAFLLVSFATGCGREAPGEVGLAPELIEVKVNGRSAAAPNSLDLLPWLGLTPAELDTVRSIRFRLESAQDMVPLLFLGYAQDVTVSGLGPPVHLGTLVPERESGGRPAVQFFHRQEGYAAHLPVELKAGKAVEVQLTYRKLVQRPAGRAVRLMAPAYVQYHANWGFSDFFNGVFQGMIWILIFYHLLLYLTVREGSYLWYCAYMLCISALTLGDVGYWQRAIFQDYPAWGWHLFQAMQYITGIMTLVFMRSFVNLRRLDPRLDRIVRWFIVGNLAILGALALWYFPTRDGRGLQLIKVLIIPFAGFGLWVCYKLLRSGNVVARYFAVAGAFTAVVVAVNAVLEQFFPEPFPGTNFIHYYWIQVAVICHLLTFALGMGYRRRQQDLELQKTKELDHLKTRFYTNITHEFRTPLTVILGMADQIPGDGKARDLIKRNANQLLRLINQLLGLSRLETQRVQPEYIYGEIVAFLRYLTESFHSLATDKGIKLVFYTEATELWMDYDPEKLQPIIFNLLSNALKFTEAGGEVVLHLREQSTKDGRWLQLKVSDTGIGIAEAVLPQIFDRFFQVENNAQVVEGTGIGLAYARELVRLLEGDIEVSSTVGKGTTFRVLLPIRTTTKNRVGQGRLGLEGGPRLGGPFLAAPEVAGIAPASAPPKMPAPETDAGAEEQPCILIVDDNADVREYIFGLLKGAYQLRQASDGESGVAAALEEVPDLIISDIMMPRRNGYELSKELKGDQRTSHIPIILLTAKVTQEDKLAGLESGADVFLTKPFDRAELLLRIENLLENRRKLRNYYAEGQVPALADALRPDPEAAFLAVLEKVVMERLDDPSLDVPQLAAAVAMSQSQMYRKLKAVTGKTPSQFMRSVRLRRGRELLTDPARNVSEIAYAVGFSDPNYFSRTFNDEFGCNPSDWRKKNGIVSL